MRIKARLSVPVVRLSGAPLLFLEIEPKELSLVPDGMVSRFHSVLVGEAGRRYCDEQA